MNYRAAIESLDPQAGMICVRCRSHFCPHMAGYLYQWPFTPRDERALATQKWNQWLAGERPSGSPRRRRPRLGNETQARLFGDDR